MLLQWLLTQRVEGAGCNPVASEFESHRSLHTFVVQWMNGGLLSRAHAGSSPVEGAMPDGLPNGATLASSRRSTMDVQVRPKD